MLQLICFLYHFLSTGGLAGWVDRSQCLCVIGVECRLLVKTVFLKLQNMIFCCLEWGGPVLNDDADMQNVVISMGSMGKKKGILDPRIPAFCMSVMMMMRMLMMTMMMMMSKLMMIMRMMTIMTTKAKMTTTNTRTTITRTIKTTSTMKTTTTKNTTQRQPQQRQPKLRQPHQRQPQQRQTLQTKNIDIISILNFYSGCPDRA